MRLVLFNYCYQKIKNFGTDILFYFYVSQKSSIFPIHFHIEKYFQTRSKPLPLMSDMEKIELLNTLIAKYDLNAKNKEGNTALNYAIFYYDKITIETLLSNPQVNVNITNNKGLNSLMLAADCHLFLTHEFTQKHIHMLMSLIEKTDFNVFYNKKSIHYIFKILDQLIYQLDEKNQAVHQIVDLFLSKLNFQIKEEKLIFHDIKNKPLSFSINPKLISLCQIYIEKKELEEKIITPLINSYDIMNDTFLHKKNRQKI